MAVASVSAECSGTAESLQRLDMKQSTVEAVGYQIIPLYIMMAAVMAFVIVSNRRNGNTKNGKVPDQDSQIVLRSSEDDLGEILKEKQDDSKSGLELDSVSNPSPTYAGSSDQTHN
jgi:cell division protein FtsL